MGTIVIPLNIYQRTSVGNPPAAFKLYATTGANTQVQVQVNKGMTDPSVYNTRCTPPLAVLNVTDSDFNTLWNCPVPSSSAHQLSYSDTNPIAPGVYRMVSYQHCSGVIYF